MPWKAQKPVDLRVEFVGRLQRGERMTDLCREYGVSRKTGHKIWSRYQVLGAVGLEDQRRAPRSIPHRTTGEVVEAILGLRQEHPSWGPKKLKSQLEEEHRRPFPAASTICCVLKRHGLITQPPQRRRHVSRPTTLQQTEAPNQVWCADYKGQFRLGDNSYCYPLTITDQHSRYLLACEGMGAISDEQSREVFQDVFREHGLPDAIRTDNGTPFASTGLAGLSKLNVYWMLHGVRHERIRPAHPEENGRHERMHRTLKAETTRPARSNLLQQQEQFDVFKQVYNTKRPHEALDMKRPAELYRSSTRPCPAVPPEPQYPMHDDALYVSRKGWLRIPGIGTVYITLALANHPVGIREELDGSYLVSFLDLNLGYAARNKPFQPIYPASPGKQDL